MSHDKLLFKSTQKQHAKTLRSLFTFLQHFSAVPFYHHRVQNTST